MLSAIEQAEKFAESDGTYVCAIAESTVIGAESCVCVIDGTQYSPSWRALAGGEQVWALQDADAAEVYAEALDEITNDWSGRHEEHLYWEDGCLWLAGRDHDFESA